MRVPNRSETIDPMPRKMPKGNIICRFLPPRFTIIAIPASEPEKAAIRIVRIVSERRPDVVGGFVKASSSKRLLRGTLVYLREASCQGECHQACGEEYPQLLHAHHH